MGVHICGLEKKPYREYIGILDMSLTAPYDITLVEKLNELNGPVILTKENVGEYLIEVTDMTVDFSNNKTTVTLTDTQLDLGSGNAPPSIQLWYAEYEPNYFRFHVIDASNSLPIDSSPDYGIWHTVLHIMDFSS